MSFIRQDELTIGDKVSYHGLDTSVEFFLVFAGENDKGSSLWEIPNGSLGVFDMLGEFTWSEEHQHYHYISGGTDFWGDAK